MAVFRPNPSLETAFREFACGRGDSDSVTTDITTRGRSHRVEGGRGGEAGPGLRQARPSAEAAVRRSCEVSHRNSQRLAFCVQAKAVARTRVSAAAGAKVARHSPGVCTAFVEGALS